MAQGQKVAEIYAELQLKTAQFKAALGEATNEMRRWSSETRRQTEEARGAMALLSEEVGVKLPRHLRSWMAEMPLVAKAMSAAFEATAVIALVGVIVEAGKKVYEFVEKNQEAAKKNREAWENSAKPIEGMADSLRLTNDRLDNAIAKLEHKPENGIKVALDEAFDSAKKLGEMIGTDSDKMRELIKQGHVGFWAQMFGNQTGTDDIEKKVTGFRKEIDDLNKEYEPVLRANRDAGNTAGYDDAQQRKAMHLEEVYGRMDKYLSDALVKYQNDAEADPTGPDRSRTIGLLSGALQVSQGEQQALGESFLADQQKARQGGLATAQSERAQELKDLERHIAERKRLHDISVSEEIEYWRKLLAGRRIMDDGSEKADRTFVGDSPERDAIQQRLSELGNRMLENAWSPGKLADMKKRLVLEAHDAPKATPLSIGGGDDEATAHAAIAQAKLNASMDEARVRYDLATGAINAHTAALRRAADHAATYNAELTALQDELAKAQQDGDLAHTLGIDDKSNDAKQTQLRQQITALRAQGQIQRLEDAQAVLGTTWHGMVDSVWDGLIARAQQTQEQLLQITAQFIDGSNDQLSKLMTGQHADFAGVFRGASQSLAKTGLEKLEGSVLKGFGLGSKKRDGQGADSGLYVTVTNGAAGPTSGITGAAGAATHSIMGWLNDSDFLGKHFGNLFGAGGIFGHFASGGDVPGGVAIDVGELGPERFVTPGPGKIIPANQTGSGGVHIGTIDARGTDPALTQAAVARAMQATHAQAVKDAARAMSDKQRRTAQ